MTLQQACGTKETGGDMEAMRSRPPATADSWQDPSRAGASMALEPVVWDRQPISLEEVMRDTALQTRIDRKFLLTPTQFTSLAGALGPRFRILEIDGLRTFRYASVYFDTPDYEQFRAHRQGRRRR